MNFFRTIKDSVYNPAFYAELDNKSVKSSIGYFYKLILIVALLATVSAFWTLSYLFKQETYNKLATYFPADLEVTLKKGEASINQPEPYIVNFPGEENSNNVFVIDTATAFLPSQFDEYKTNVILKKEFLAIRDNSKVQLLPLNTIGDFTLNQSAVRTVGGYVGTILKKFSPIIFALLYIVFIIAHSLQLIYLFITALLVMLAASLLKQPKRYMKAYQIGLHAITLPILIALVMSFTPYSLPTYFFTIILLVVVVANLVGIKKEPEAVVVPQPAVIV